VKKVEKHRCRLHNERVIEKINRVISLTTYYYYSVDRSGLNSAVFDNRFLFEVRGVNSYLCNQLGNALFCVTSGIFAGRAQRDPAKSHELHKIAFPNVLHIRFFLILTKKVSSNVKRSNEFH
jgi:hypothetical protein